MTRTALVRRSRLFVVAVAAVLALVTAAGAAEPELAAQTRPSVGSGLVGLIVEPSKLGSAAGMQPVYAFVLSARRSVDMTMYELADPTMEADLIADRRRGVEVRVLLDTNRERSRNLAAFESLTAGGVKVVWADTEYEATHQKTITVDGTESLILTANLTSEYYTTTRDFGVFDTDARDLSAIEAVFDADFAHRPITPSNGADLVWSPGSEAQMLAVIDGARHTLSIENEEMNDSAITNAIAAAAGRGVKVEITMTTDSSFDSDFDVIVRAGGHVHLYEDDPSDLYVHAKTTIADAGLGTQRVYVGSINFSSASTDRNRELGIITTDPTIIEEIDRVVRDDYSNCTAATACEEYS
ncbi:MAG: phospholipase D-like domain-containing protein [Acidimicrobiales bacterium]|jgi:phosphatidylserine/phosphatidylglycerophosphate/cardiolipin synthase-like enzyme